MKRSHFLHRILALFLTLSLSLPAESFALRPAGLEESPNTKRDLLTALGISSGLEEVVEGDLKKRLSEIKQRDARALAREIYDTVEKEVAYERGLEQNLRAAVQAIDRIRAKRDIPFEQFWVKTGIQGDRIFISFRPGKEPVLMWLDKRGIRDLAVEEENVSKQIGPYSLLGGNPEPKLLPKSFQTHHPKERWTHGITFTAGQMLELLGRNPNSRATLIMTGKGKREIAIRLARGWVGRFDGDMPISFLWQFPKQVDLFIDKEADPGEELKRRLMRGGFNVRFIETPEQIGEEVATNVMTQWHKKVFEEEGQFTLALVTGSTPEHFLKALTRELQTLPDQQRIALLEAVVLFVPDDYVYETTPGRFKNIPLKKRFSAAAIRKHDFVIPAIQGLPRKTAARLQKLLLKKLIIPKAHRVGAQMMRVPPLDHFVVAAGPDGHVLMDFPNHYGRQDQGFEKEDRENVRLFDPRELLQQKAGLAGKKRIVVILNSKEPAGVFGRPLASLGLPVEVIQAYDPSQAHLIPSDPADWDWENIQGLVVMGGPPNVYQSGTYLWLEDLTRLMRFAVEHQVPCLGVCLGAQLMARAIGGEVTPDPGAPPGVTGPKGHRERGWRKVRLTKAGRRHPFLEGFEKSFLLGELHGDTIRFREGATLRMASGRKRPVELLARGRQVRWQAFSVGNAVAVLGHPEFDPWGVAKGWFQVADNRKDEPGNRVMRAIEEMRDSYDKSHKSRRDLAAKNWWKMVANAKDSKLLSRVQLGPITLNYARHIVTKLVRRLLEDTEAEGFYVYPVGPRRHFVERAEVDSETKLKKWVQDYLDVGELGQVVDHWFLKGIAQKEGEASFFGDASFIHVDLLPIPTPEEEAIQKVVDLAGDRLSLSEEAREVVRDYLKGEGQRAFQEGLGLLEAAISLRSDAPESFPDEEQAQRALLAAWVAAKHGLSTPGQWEAIEAYSQVWGQAIGLLLRGIDPFQEVIQRLVREGLPKLQVEKILEDASIVFSGLLTAGLEEKGTQDQGPDSPLRRNMLIGAGGAAGAAALGSLGAIGESVRSAIMPQQGAEQAPPIEPERLLTTSELEAARDMGYFPSLLPEGSQPAEIHFEVTQRPPSEAVRVEARERGLRITKEIGTGGQVEEARVQTTLVGSLPEAVAYDLLVFWVEVVNARSVRIIVTPEGHQAQRFDITGEEWLQRGREGVLRPIFVRLSHRPEDGLAPYKRFVLAIDLISLYPMEPTRFSIGRADAYQTPQYARALQAYSWPTPSVKGAAKVGAAAGVTLGALGASTLDRHMQRRREQNARWRAQRRVEKQISEAERQLRQDREEVLRMGVILQRAQELLRDNRLDTLRQQEGMLEGLAIQRFQERIRGLLDGLAQGQKTVSDRARFARELKGELKTASRGSLLDDEQELRNALLSGSLMMIGQLADEIQAIPYAILLGDDLLKAVSDVMTPRSTFTGLEELAQEVQQGLQEAFEKFKEGKEEEDRAFDLLLERFPKWVEEVRRLREQGFDGENPIAVCLRGFFDRLDAESQRNFTAMLATFFIAKSDRTIAKRKAAEAFVEAEAPRLVSGEDDLFHIVGVLTAPALDVGIQEVLEDWEKGRVFVVAGGGATNMGWAVHVMWGAPLSLVLTLQGAIGGYYQNALMDAGLPPDEVFWDRKANKQTRAAIGISKKDKTFNLTPKGTPLSPEEGEQLKNRAIEIIERLKGRAIVVFSGSLAPGLPEDYVKRFGIEVQERGGKFILDTKGMSLKSALLSDVPCCFMITPTAEEFLEALEIPGELRKGISADPEQLIRLAWEVVQRGGVEYVVLTRDKDGAILVGRDVAYVASGPEVVEVDALGAGDTFTGKMAFHLRHGSSLGEALWDAVRWASTSVAVHGPGGGTMDMARRLSKQTRVQRFTLAQDPKTQELVILPVTERLQGDLHTGLEEGNPPLEEKLAIRQARVADLLLRHFRGRGFEKTDDTLRDFKEILRLIPPLLEPTSPLAPEFKNDLREPVISIVMTLAEANRLTGEQARDYLLNPTLQLARGSVWLALLVLSLRNLQTISRTTRSEEELISVDDPEPRALLRDALAFFMLGATTADPQQWIAPEYERGQLLGFTWKQLIHVYAESVGESLPELSENEKKLALDYALPSDSIPSRLQDLAQIQDTAHQLNRAWLGAKILSRMAAFLGLSATAANLDAEANSRELELARSYPTYELLGRDLFSESFAGLEEAGQLFAGRTHEEMIGLFQEHRPWSIAFYKQEGPGLESLKLRTLYFNSQDGGVGRFKNALEAQEFFSENDRFDLEILSQPDELVLEVASPRAEWEQPPPDRVHARVVVHYAKPEAQGEKVEFIRRRFDDIVERLGEFRPYSIMFYLEDPHTGLLEPLFGNFNNKDGGVSFVREEAKNQSSFDAHDIFTIAIMGSPDPNLLALVVQGKDNWGPPEGRPHARIIIHHAELTVASAGLEEGRVPVVGPELNRPIHAIDSSV